MIKSTFFSAQHESADSSSLERHVRKRPRRLSLAGIKVEKHSIMGGIWLIGWLFAVGFLHLSFWSGVAAIFIWPYYIGANMSEF